MILKFGGCIFILISSIALGIYYSFKTEYRMNDLVEMKKALILFMAEIKFNLSPLAEAMSNVSAKVNSPAGKIFKDFSERLGDCDINAEELWKNVLLENLKYSYFENEDIENFISFGKALGYLDVKQQSSNIEVVLSYIELKISELFEKSKRDKKMYGSLGLFGGIVVMVVLI